MRARTNATEERRASGGRTGALLMALLLCAAMARSQSFYDPAVIQDIRIDFSRADWRKALDTAKSGFGSYIIAERVRINGEMFKKVGVKFKGKSSYAPTNAKNSIHLELNHVKRGQDYDGVNDIKLNSAFADPSFIREALAYEILRCYTDAPRCNFARVSINGTFQGVYSNAEAVDKRFLRSRFGSSDGVFFKCIPEHPSVKHMPSLVPLGSDSAAYTATYELKSKNGWRELFALIAALGSTTAPLDPVLDVDRALWMLAFNMVTLNLDSYSGHTAHNYYLYQDATKRFLPIAWDLNTSFGTCQDIGPGKNIAPSQLPTLDPLLYAASKERPLISRLLSDPTLKRKYFAHMRTMLHEWITNHLFRTRAETLMRLIVGAVKEDAGKFYSDEQFRNSLTKETRDASRVIPAIVPLMQARAAYLLGRPELKAKPPVMGRPGLSLSRSANGRPVTITVSVQQAQRVLLAYRPAPGDSFKTIAMHDDGQHADGNAKDGVYGASFPDNSRNAQYYIYAENESAGVFFPERAERDVLGVTK